MSTSQSSSPPDERGGRPRFRALLAAALVVVTVAAYARSLQFDFITFDDPNYVTANGYVERGLTAEGVRWAFTTGHAENWHPVTWLSHMLDVELFGLDPAGHHATNVLLHAANTLLLFLFLAWVTGATAASAWIAGMFALHPLHVESVAWIAERKDLLSTLFGFYALLAHAAWARRGKPLFYVATMLALALSLASKPMFVTLPFLLLLLDFWPLERTRQHGWGRLAAEKLPLLALVVASSWITLRVQAVTEADLASLPVGPRLANAVTAYAAYMADTVWPTGLGLLYPHPYLPGGEPLATAEIGIASAILGAITAFVLWRRRPWSLVGWGWFLGMLVPVIGLVQVGFQARADRYTYVPLVGIWIAVAFSARAATGQRPGLAKVAGLAGALSLAACATLTWVQLGHWKDSESIYKHTIAVEPRAAMMEANLAMLYMNRGDRELAERHFKSAIEVDPTLDRAFVDLGVLLRAQNRFAEAEGYFRRALELNALDHKARGNLAWVLAAQGKFGAARNQLHTLLESDPNNALAHRVSGMVSEATGAPNEARRAYERALELDGSGLYHIILAEHLARRGERPAALALLRQALSLGHDPLGTSTSIGYLLLDMGKGAEARMAFDQALAIDPEHTAALQGRARAANRP